MALTYTPEGALGSPLPDFTLNAVDGRTIAARDVGARALLVAFICNHCPYVRAIEARLITLAREFAPRGLVTLAICANDPADHPEDAPAELLRRARELDYPFAYLFDETQAVARAFGAVCTPDFFLYESRRQLVYRGRLDDSWRDAAKVSRRELAIAIDQVLSDAPVATAQNPAMGCSIKWRT